MGNPTVLTNPLSGITPMTVADLTPVAMLLVVRVVHRLRPRWLSSVLPGMRWKFFFACIERPAQRPPLK